MKSSTQISSALLHYCVPVDPLCVKSRKQRKRLSANTFSVSHYLSYMILEHYSLMMRTSILNDISYQVVLESLEYTARKNKSIHLVLRILKHSTARVSSFSAWLQNPPFSLFRGACVRSSEAQLPSQNYPRRSDCSSMSTFKDVRRYKVLSEGLLVQLAVAYRCNSSLIQWIGAKFWTQNLLQGLFDLHRRHQGS